MAIVRQSLREIRASRPTVDRSKIAATTEADIEKHAAEDNTETDDLSGFEPAILPQAIRRQLNMSQAQFADALRIPLATLRNWEQGRVKPDPAARSLLLIVARNPEASLAALAT